MSYILDRRSKLFEDEFFYRLELDYKVRARADLKFGIWAAEELGVTDKNRIKQYAMRLVENEVVNSKRHIDLVHIDFESAGKDVQRSYLISVYQVFYEHALKEMENLG